MNSDGNQEDRCDSVHSLGVIVLALSSVRLISSKLSLPPYSFETEGKYVAYGMQVWAFLWTLPLVVSLFLAGYLAFPPMFRRFHIAIRGLSILLAIGGFGVTALLITSAFINNKVFPLLAAAGLSSFWIMAILATLAFRKSRP